METAKLEATAEQFNRVTNRLAVGSHVTDKPAWFRVCQFIPSYAVAGRLTIQFHWNYTREGIFSALFKAVWGVPDLIVQFRDTRVSKIRVVRTDYEPTHVAYMDVLIDNINHQELFQINTKLLSDAQAKPYAGNVDANIPEGYSAYEYGIT